LKHPTFTFELSKIFLHSLKKFFSSTSLTDPLVSNNISASGIGICSILCLKYPFLILAFFLVYSSSYLFACLNNFLQSINGVAIPISDNFFPSLCISFLDSCYVLLSYSLLNFCNCFLLSILFCLKVSLSPCSANFDFSSDSLFSFSSCSFPSVFSVFSFFLVCLCSCSFFSVSFCCSFFLSSIALS